MGITHAKSGKSYRLIVNIGNKETQWIVDYPKFRKDSVWVEQSFCEGLSAAVNAILVYPEPIPCGAIKKLAHSLPTGISSENHLKTLTSTCPSNKSYVWTTFRATNKLVHNMYDTVPMHIAGHTGIYNPVKYVPNIRDLTPFLFIASRLEVALAQKVLCEVLKVVWSHFSALVAEKDGRVEKESKVFVRILGLALLSLNPSVSTDDFIKTIGNLMLLSPVLQRRLLKMISTTINFWMNIESASLFLFWETVKANVACDTVEYADIINISILLRFMKSMDASLKGLPCCNRHSDSKGYTKYSLGVRYDSMRSLLKFIIINNSSAAADNISRIARVILEKPCGCLLVTLIILLRDLAECNVGYTLELQKLGVINDLVKVARGYSADVKVECIFFASVVMDQLYKGKTPEMKSFKFALLYMLETSSEVRGKFEAKISLFKAGLQRSRSVQCSVCDKKLVSPLDDNRSRSKSVSDKGEVILSSEFAKRQRTPLTARSRKSNLNTYMVTETPELQKESETRSFLFAESPLACRTPTRTPKRKTKLPHSCLQTIQQDLQLICFSLFLWLVGERPNKSSLSYQNPVIKKPQALSVLITLIKKEDNDHATKICLQYLSSLAQSKVNAQHLLRSGKLMNWLISLEVHWYGRPRSFGHSEELKTAFDLHSVLLCEGMRSKEGLSVVMQAMMMWSYTIQLGDEVKGRRLSLGNLVSNETESNSWVCLKNVLVKALEHASGKLLQMWVLTELGFKLIIGHSAKRGIGAISFSQKANPFSNPFAPAEDSVHPFYISDQEFIEKFLDLAIDFGSSEGVVEEQRKFLDEVNSQALPINGHTQFLIALVKIGLRNLPAEDLELFLSKVYKVSQLIARLAEFTKDQDIEKENLLLLVAILLQEHTRAQKSKNEAKAQLLRSCLNSVIHHVTADNTYMLTKDFLTKALNMSKRSVNSPEDESSMYSSMHEKSTQASKALAKVSDKAFSDLRLELRKVVESFIRRRQEVKVEAARGRFSINP